ncbi:MAG: TIM barrel protein [Candidatus Eremiobacteraeota bacterium]|nr:TIM barrel protein [Candidatus Eremiobacteraeota bacterium]MBC5803425.1 TIM barrel protein [Candidatus Eremiobacteraeota bacterium]MBC5821974.1 TIM barrel protein [Candidatus Eremiobacteraeota bacterium]
MKIACSSATFARAFAEGTLTQLEWLDLCANELEVDGVVFDTRDFPRDDADYLAQLKKSAADLGLTVAALEAGDAPATERLLSVAVTLGAPLLVIRAPGRSGEATAWGRFAADVKSAAAHAKRFNVTLALRAFSGTLCESTADCKRLAKDVDSSWMRFAISNTSEDDAALLSKSVIATHAIADIDNFATVADDEAPSLISSLARFRGFIVFDYDVTPSDHAAYHHALTRFAALRAKALSPPSN